MDDENMMMATQSMSCAWATIYMSQQSIFIAGVQVQLTIFWTGYTGWEFNSWTEVPR